MSQYPIEVYRDRALLPGGAEREISIRDAIGTIRRRRWLILSIFGIFLAGAVALSLLSEPSYRSVSSILVESRQANQPLFDPNDPVAAVSATGLILDVPTQIEVLQSYRILADAFSRLNLRAPVPGSDVRGPVVNIRQVGQTSTLQVVVDAQDPKTAQDLADAVPQVYLDYVRTRRRQEVESALQFLQKRYKDESDLLTKAERDLERFRRGRNFVSIEQEGAELSQRLTRAEMDEKVASQNLAGAKERYQTLVAERAKVPPTVTNPATRNTLERIAAVKSDIASLKAELASAQVTYSDRSPQVREAKARLTAREAYLASIPKTESQRTIERNPLLNEYDLRISDARSQMTAAQASHAEAVNNLKDARAALQTYSGQQPKEAALQREILQRGATVESLSKTVETLSLRQNSVRDPVSILSQGSLPEQVSPNWRLNLALALVLATILSVGLVSLREHLDERISAHDVTVGGYATLGFVNTNVVIGKLPAAHRTGIAEPYRLLSYNLIYSSEDRPVRSMLVASSTRREGRTTVAVNLATVLASEGKKVAIVDANLRRPSLHKIFGIEATGGLTEYLAGTQAVDGLLVPTPTQNVFIVPTGPVADVPSKLLDSAAMRELIVRLQEQVDYVIVDAPATTAGPDAQILSTMVDGVVYVARLDVTKKSSLRYGLDLLAKAHANVLGVVIGDPTQTAAQDVYAED